MGNDDVAGRMGGAVQHVATGHGGALRPRARQAASMLVLGVSTVVGAILTLVGVLLLWSYPGKPRPFVDEQGRPLPGSLAEKIHVNINGVAQGMIIKSKDETNPVLLYLHGGMPEYFLTQQYPTGLEDYFTVAWWEQRGAGLSYSGDVSRKTMTVAQFMADTLEVTHYLRHRFGKDKIYLMGHSGGTFIGIKAVARAPELYYAYIGVAQMSDQLNSERLAYDYMLGQFKKNGNKRMARRLEATPVTMAGGIPDAYLAVRDKAMHSLGVGTTHDMKSHIGGVFWRSLQNREYTLGEKATMWRAKALSGASVLWDELIATDLADVVPALALPTFFFHGVYDYTCSYTEARSYSARLIAPVKGFYTFEHSAHSPIFEEPERALTILREDVLVGKNGLADPMNQAASLGA
jgi:pimeloyl-ACP methyl ester carboxylesterase